MRRTTDLGLFSLALLFALWLGGVRDAGLVWAAEEAQPRPPALEKISGPPTCLSPAEAELAGLIDAYRKANGLMPFKRSGSLTLVAKWHAFDLEVNRAAKMKDEQGQPCGFHSWSDRGGERWTRLCYNSDPRKGEKMWGKPREVTGKKYRGNGYENVYFNSDSQKVTPARILELWKQRQEENDVMLQEGSWAFLALPCMGVALSEHYAVVWFGDEPDREGEIAACSAAPQ